MKWIETYWNLSHCFGSYQARGDEYLFDLDMHVHRKKEDGSAAPVVQDHESDDEFVIDAKHVRVCAPLEPLASTV
jgi:hypothetical protein